MIHLQKLKNRSSSPATLRLQKDINELELPPNIKTDFANVNNLHDISVEISPTQGPYQNGTFTFKMEIPMSYPHDPPKLKCTQTIYHPNIDIEGSVCLNVLRADWNPVLGLQSVLFGLLMLFHEPNPLDPLNKDAAQQMRESMDQYLRTVKDTMRGRFYQGVQYTSVYKGRNNYYYD
eukprot:NODE_170_length_14437_cov_1.447273.p10 type:complete len:177 gc:universal NODE_170_length_14437_cov_1.447273:5027-4497(-)